MYVLGSNDYYAPTLENPLAYLDPARPAGPTPARMATAVEDLGGVPRRGLDGPHRQRATAEDQRARGSASAASTTPHPARPVRDGRRLGDRPSQSLGVTHAPYRRILDAMARTATP